MKALKGVFRKIMKDTSQYTFHPTHISTFRRNLKHLVCSVPHFLSESVGILLAQGTTLTMVLYGPRPVKNYQNGLGPVKKTLTGPTGPVNILGHSC